MTRSLPMRCGMSREHLGPNLGPVPSRWSPVRSPGKPIMTEATFRGQAPADPRIVLFLARDIAQHGVREMRDRTGLSEHTLHRVVAKGDVHSARGCAQTSPERIESTALASSRRRSASTSTPSTLRSPAGR